MNVLDSVATFQDPLFRESKVEYIMPTSPLQHKWLLQSHFDSVYIKENIKLHHLQNIYELKAADTPSVVLDNLKSGWYEATKIFPILRTHAVIHPTNPGMSILRILKAE